MGENSIFTKIKCAIFDMDGLMFDTEILAEEIWSNILKEYNLEPNKEFLDSIKGRNILDSKKIFESYYKTDVSFLTLKEERNKRLEAKLRCEGVPIKKGLIECLNFLKDKNILLALASSSSKKLILDNLTDTNLLSYFSYIVSGEDLKQSKPNPEIFLKCSSYFNLNVEECIVLEDSKAGIDAAINAGMKAIWIPDLVKFDIPDNVIKLNSLLDVINL